MRDTLSSAMKTAMKNKQKDELKVIRMIQAKIKDADIADRANGNTDGVGDNKILAVLKNMIKQRTESLKIYTDAGRTELAETEAFEIEVIEKFLPPMMSESEITDAVHTAIAKTGAETMAHMGKVMGYLKTNYDVTLDMGVASKILKGKLS